MKTTELVARNAAVKKKRSEDLAEKMASSKFLKAKRALYSKIERDMLNADFPELNEKLLAIDAQNYAELADIKWLFNNGDWREENELKQLEIAAVYRIAAPEESAKYGREKIRKAEQDCTIEAGVLGALFPIILFALWSSWADEGDVIFLSYCLIFSIPAILLICGGFALLGVYLLSSALINFYTKRKGVNIEILEDFENEGVNFETCSVKNVLVPFLEIDKDKYPPAKVKKKHIQTYMIIPIVIIATIVACSSLHFIRIWLDGM